MIDTIVLTIHNTDKYAVTKEKFFHPTGDKGQTMQIIDRGTGEITEAPAVIATYYGGTGKVLPFIHRNTIRIASSAYEVGYSTNEADNRISFTFSIPKYIFTSNVFQFINLYDQSPKVMYHELRKFINQFIIDHCPDKILLDDISIDRIDFCYNQFFNSDRDAETYMNHQKQMSKKWGKSVANKSVDYGRSIHYATKRWSFKIYHKGTEFKKNDYKELTKYGKNKLGIDLNWLQAQADCINRYEVTYRKSMLNYLFHQYYFNGKRQLKIDETTQDFAFKQYAKHPVRLIMNQLLQFPMRDVYEKEFNAWIERRKTFTLKSMFDVCEDPTKLVHTDTVTFGEDFFTILYNHFKATVQKWQIKQMMDFGTIHDRIRQHNENVETQNKLEINMNGKKRKDSLRILMAGMLAQFTRLADLKPFMNRMAWHRLEKDLKAIGIDHNTAKIDVPTPKLDYTDYKVNGFPYYHKF